MENNIRRTAEEDLLRPDDPALVAPALNMDEASMKKSNPIEHLKRWDVNIKFCDVGCMVQVGCRTFAFNTISEMMIQLEEYIKEPLKKIKEFNY